MQEEGVRNPSRVTWVHAGHTTNDVTSKDDRQHINAPGLGGGEGGGGGIGLGGMRGGRGEYGAWKTERKVREAFSESISFIATSLIQSFGCGASNY